MQVAVTFRHMEADESVKAYVRDKVQKLEKYILNPAEIHVVLRVEKFRHLAEITMVGNGGVLNSQGRDNDLYAAIDQMVDKMERQIRERREKVRRKRAVSSKVPVLEGEKGGEGKQEGEIPGSLRRKRTVAKPMSVEEALSQLSGSDEDFLVFMNSDTGQLNVVYRSKKGGYGWVEPHA